MENSTVSDTTPKKYTHLFVLCGYFIITLLFLWPLFSDLNHQVPGVGTDIYMYTWSNWWFHNQFPFSNVFITDHMLRPNGHSLVFHSHTFGNALLSWPLQFLSPILIINILIIFSFLLAAYAAYLLGLELGFSVSIAFIVGIINGFNPYRIAHLNQLNFLSTGWMALFLWLALRLRPQGWKVVFGLAACSAMQIYSSYYYGFYLACLVGVALIYIYFTTKTINRRYLVQLVFVLLILLLLLVPIFSGMLDAKNRDEWIETPAQGMADFFTPDISFFFLPSPDHLLWGGLTTRYFEWVRGKQVGTKTPLHKVLTEFIFFPGWIVLLLAGIGLYKNKNSYASLFGIVTLIAFVFMLGTHICIFGIKLFPFLGRLFSEIPFLNSFRVPGRIGAVWMLALAVLAGYGLEIIKNHKKIIVIVLILLLEYFPKIPVQTIKIPEVYQDLAQHQENYTICEVPFGIRSGFGPLGIEDTRLMLFATVHQKKRFGGMVARIRQERIRQYQKYPILSTVLLWQANLTGKYNSHREYKNQLQQSIQRDYKWGRSFLVEHNLRYIIVHLDMLKEHYGDNYQPQIAAAMVEYLQKFTHQYKGKTWGRVIVVGK